MIIVNEAKVYIQVMGRFFLIMAMASDNAAGDVLANAYMAAMPGAAVLTTTQGWVYIAHKDDKGFTA